MSTFCHFLLTLVFVFKKKKKRHDTTYPLQSCLYNLHIRIACKYTHTHTRPHTHTNTHYNYRSEFHEHRFFVSFYRLYRLAFLWSKNKKTLFFNVKHRYRSSSYTFVCRLLSVSADTRNEKLLYNIKQKEKKSTDIHRYTQAHTIK